MQSAALKPTAGGFLQNPAIKRIRIAAEKEGASSNAATYAGVISKTMYFLIVTMVGIGLFFFLDPILTNMANGEIYTHASSNGIFLINITVIGGIVIAAVAVITLITALIAILARKAIPVVGTLYVICEGYLLAFINNTLAPDYKWIGILALVLTVAIVLALLFLNVRAGVRPSGKFMKYVSAIFVTIILGGIIMFVLHFIPGLSAIASAYDTMMANPVISIGLGVFFILIACLFLISDFEAVRQIVASGADKKYEWGCAFGIAYTVLYLYFKIFEIIVKVAGSKRS